MSADGRTHETMPMRMHPRVFTALGKELVTNDVVAVIELVKNAYDAFAYYAKLSFRHDDFLDRTYLEIQDDGLGMTRKVIEESWCLVATPYRVLHPYVQRGNRERRVVGAKGLGRLAVARLGQRLTMLTQAPQAPCWEVTVDWTDIASQEDLVQSTALCREYAGVSPFAESGTLLRIDGLYTDWDSEHLADLRDNLARLLSPFAEQDDFHIVLYESSSLLPEVPVEPPAFLAAPKYCLRGQADRDGNISGVYRFAPLSNEGIPRCKKLTQSWYNIRQSMRNPQQKRTAECGPFAFEIRAWDIGANDTQEISTRFPIQKNQIRQAIRAHKGLSVYRDGVLVLPKSDGARDWLGLDLRRVALVGHRLSTSQVVGFVAITAEHNPRLEDTSDRERLLACPEVSAFETILRAAASLLENERARDRTPSGKARPMAALFDQLSASELVADIEELAEQGRSADEALPLVREFDTSLFRTQQNLRERFVYYSRLATVGTIAQMLVHEIRNRTTAFGALLRAITPQQRLFADPRMKVKLDRAHRAVKTLEQLADKFAPLASRNFRQRRQTLNLEAQIQECLAMNEVEIRNKHIVCRVPPSQTPVLADPGELDTIFLNLITNAVYWLGEVPKESRHLEFNWELTTSGDRVQIWIHDSGPGIDPDDLERVFLPGVTRRPDGIGMGLNVASELVAACGGEMKALLPPTPLRGASFTFDLPYAGTRKEATC